jgi:hypothetical protein
VRATNVPSAAKCHLDRPDRLLDRPHRTGLGLLAEFGGRRVLALGQSVDPIVEQQDVQVDVAPDGVDQMIGADRQPVSVAGDDPYRQLRIGALDARRNRRRAAMNPVKPIRIHVVGKPRRTADPRDEHEVLAGTATRAALSGSEPESSNRRSRGTNGPSGATENLCGSRRGGSRSGGFPGLSLADRGTTHGSITPQWRHELHGSTADARRPCSGQRRTAVK